MAGRLWLDVSNIQMSCLPTGGDCPHVPPVTSLRPQNVVNVPIPTRVPHGTYSICTAAFQWIYHLANICSTFNHWGLVWRIWSDPREEVRHSWWAYRQCRRHRLWFLWRTLLNSSLYLPLFLTWWYGGRMSFLLNHNVSSHEFYYRKYTAFACC